VRISVVIATYRRAASLARTLDTIARQARMPDEVIVVDQSPESERYQIVKVIESAIQMGLNLRPIWSDVPSSTRARNLGLAAASGDWVIFSDDDVDWPTPITCGLITKIGSMPALAMIGARDTCVPASSRKFLRVCFAAFFLTNTFRPLPRGRVFACMQAKYPQPIVGDMETEWATGYWFAVEKAFVSRHRLTFDEKMTRYAQAEDMLFSHKLYLAAKSEDRKCIVSEELAVAHLVSQEWREPDAFADLCGAWNRIYIAGQLRKGARFWLSLGAIYWAAVHQFLVRVVLKRPVFGHIRAYWIAMWNLGKIRNGDFTSLYSRYEK